MLLLRACRHSLWIGLLVCACSVSPVDATENEQADQEKAQFFETKVRPLLVERCYECHGPDVQESGLRVDSLQALLDGGERGPAIVPGDAKRSLLIHAVNHSEPDLQMPEGEKLSGAEILALIKWIDDGAIWPGQQAEQRKQWDIDGLQVTEEDRQFWAFRPLRRPELPEVNNAAWCQTPIDWFVLAGLEKQGLRPASPASKLELVRRVYFDLWGLPPTPEQVQEFLEDRSPDAYERLVDRLLASPRYGERWGRHWLDVARYADSNGLDENWAFEFIYRYRDWVIEAINDDMPYDQFVRHQIAGDLLPGKEGEPFEERVKRIAAAGFLSVGPKMIADDDQMKKKMDIVDEQLSTIGQTFLGLTIGCARCHDHKFDPIPTRDYYAMAGILKSTRTMEHLRVVAPVWLHELKPPGFDQQMQEFERRKAELVAQRDQFWWEVAGPAYLAAQKKETEKKEAEQEAGAAAEKAEEAAEAAERPQMPPEKELEKWVPEEHRQRWKELVDAIAQHETTRPQPVKVMAPTEGEPEDIPISLRGNYLTPGPVVPRGFLQIFQSPGSPPPKLTGSGRLELAEWLVTKAQALCARVLVNRLWRWRMGRGIVSTPDNFGRLGARPSHPELLDWLASELVDSGWSIKHMHRQMLLSATYQMSSRYDERAAALDPENRWLWRYSRRRLEAEAIRDAMLMVSGKLDLQMGGSLMPLKDRTYVTGTASNQQQYDNPRRSVYQPIYRSAVYDVLSAYDFPDPATPTGDRKESVVAPQSLLMMNGELIHSCARAVAQRVVDESSYDSQRLEMMWQRLLCRHPTDQERHLALEYLHECQQTAEGTSDGLEAWASVARALLASNEFIYID